MQFSDPSDTICALSTPSGVGAISLIRLSGKKSLEIIGQVFSKDISKAVSHTAHFGKIKSDEDILDEVVVTVYLNPRSFTGEDMIEIACHGSRYVQAELLKLLLSKGARLATPGEFSLRAFLNGKMDLSQTEAVADLIHAGSKAAHKVAMNQMRGGFSKELNDLRQQLLNFASLVELELDFSQEDVEFADRTQLKKLIAEIDGRISKLADSFKLGNAIKNGVPVAIVGPPNAGKSTLLNALLNEEKAIVSDIAGTTRDVIEDTVIVDGIEFRFIDTAGIRETADRIELLGIERSFEQIKKASVILLLFDLTSENAIHIQTQIDNFRKNSVSDDQVLIPVLNKTDMVDTAKFESLKNGVFISAGKKLNLDQLKKNLLNSVQNHSLTDDQLIVTNVRHYEILKKCKEALSRIQEGMENDIPGDLLAMDIREIIYHLGEITGTISNDELLGNIFANFCIGK